MENLAEKIEQPPATQPAPPAKGSLWRLQGIFFQPKETFQEIAKKPTWLIAVIVCMVIGFVGFILIMNQIGFESIIRQQMQERGQEVTDEQLQMMNSPFMQAFRYISVIVGTPVVLLVTAALLLALFWLIGAEVSFSRVFSVVAHSFLAFTLISTVIGVVIVMLASDPTELDVQNLVASNLGALVTRKDSPVLFAVLASIDILTFYYLFLLSLGLSIVSRKSVGTSAAMVFVLWGVWVLAKAGLAAVFS